MRTCGAPALCRLILTPARRALHTTLTPAPRIHYGTASYWQPLSPHSCYTTLQLMLNCLHAHPQNGEPKRYRLQPSCCRVELNPRGSAYRCAHPWQPSTELPYGNPITGRAWDKDRPDFGKYDGGDFQDSEEFKARGAASGQTGNMGNAVGQAAGGGSAS